MASNSGVAIGSELAEILNGYAEEVRQVAEKEIERTAKETAQKIKDASPRSNNAGAHYADGWTVKKVAGGYVVYNRNKPQLTHLLEKGHAKVNGGRVPGVAHIAPAQAWAETTLLQRITAGLNKNA